MRIKSCKACENAAKKCEKPKPHDCQKNWSASAKSMEADMAASMLKQHEENNSENVLRFVTDNDSTTIAKLRTEVKHEIEDIKDINHMKKNLGTHLYNLQVKHKALTPKVIGYLQKCFAYVLTRQME